MRVRSERVKERECVKEREREKELKPLARACTCADAHEATAHKLILHSAWESAPKAHFPTRAAAGRGDTAKAGE